MLNWQHMLAGRSRTRWLVAGGLAGVLVLLAAGAAFLLLQPRLNPAPQAAASAPLPTLVAAEATEQPATTSEAAPEATPDRSPFAGIAEPAPPPPQRPQ